MQQYARFKQRHPGCVLLFRIGDFYEMFDEDAVTVSKAIGLTLTQRTAGVPMAGVPHHQLESYLRRLTAKGFRVAVCEQLIDASAAKGIVPRAVTRVITPGTLVDDTLLETDASVAVAALGPLEATITGPLASPPEASRVALAVVEASTGAFALVRCAAAAIVDELARRGVRELLIAEHEDASAGDHPLARALATVRGAGIAIAPRPSWHFRTSDALEALREHYQVATLAGFGLRDDDAIIAPAGAALRYLQETQTLSADEAREVKLATGIAVRRGSLAHLRPPKVEEPDAHLIIDAVSLRSLEVLRPLRESLATPASGRAAPAPTRTDGSLLGVFLGAGDGQGSPRSPLGRRLLRDWLCRPLRDATAIASRQACVEALAHERRLADEAGPRLAQVQDLSRIAGRTSLARATPRDVVALARSISAGAEIASVLARAPALALLHASIERDASTLAPLAHDIVRLCADEPPPHTREGGMIRDGVDAELDEARLLERDAGAWLSQYQARLIGEHSLPSLKVGYNKVAGYFIELPQAQARAAPPALKRMQTLRNAERFTTPELAEFERKVSTAQARALAREKELFLALCDRALVHIDAIASLASALAELDVLLAFADKAVHRAWVRPAIASEATLAITQGRHPVLEEVLATDCVPNDCALSAVSESHAAAPLALITGPNMAGKSTYIRQVALIALLAHTGSFVPASSATVGLTDRIFTRIGADDALHAGQSTFMVEMIETAHILHHASPSSLVVLDEVGRGTSTLDGLSLAWAIVEHLAARAPRTLFATHYHELTTLEDQLPGRVANLHVSVREWPSGDDHAQIVFLHRILPGRTDRSYGLHVARLAGMPREVVARANDVLKSLAVKREGDHAASPIGTPTGAGAQSSDAVAPRKGRKAAPLATPLPADDTGQFALFTQYVPHPAMDALRELKLEQMTPMQAWDELRRLRNAVSENAAPS
jgi:DNA mismatch repair protein MutS